MKELGLVAKTIMREMSLMVMATSDYSSITLYQGLFNRLIVDRDTFSLLTMVGG